MEYSVNRYKHGKTWIVYNKTIKKIVCTAAGNYKLFRSEQAAYDWVAAQ